MFAALLLGGVPMAISASAPPVAAWDASLHLHPADTVSRFNARCLDGSPGGYYFRPASTKAGATKWKFHFMGGGWCSTATSCAERAKGLLGSSKTWTPALSNLWGKDAGFYGLMSANDTAVNPFGDWNFVWLAYCDGTSQTSDRADPVVVGGQTIHFRGRALLDAHIFELEREHKFLSTASEVIISGTSAGGMSTYIQSSFIESQLKAPGARLVAVPDAGWWWDHTKYGDSTVHVWLDGMEISIVPDSWNATLRGKPGACLAAAGGNNGGVAAAKCFTQPYAYAYVGVPTFVVQSFADPANLGFCYQMPCGLSGESPGSCNASEVTSIKAYGKELRDSILTAQGSTAARDGHFLTSCNQHEETCRSFDWWGITIGGQTMNSTFYTWYTEGGKAPGATAVDGDWPTDSTCTRGGHGNC